MPPDSRSRRIVVGYDGSPASRAALARAAERAGEDGHIYIVHAYSLPNDWLGMPNYQQLLDAALDRAQMTIDRIETESGADLQGVSWETEVIGAPPPAPSPTPPAPRRGRDHRRHPRLRARPRAARQRRPRADPPRRLPDHRDPRARRRPRGEPRDGGSGVMSYEDTRSRCATRSRRRRRRTPAGCGRRCARSCAPACHRRGGRVAAAGAARDGRPRRPRRADHRRRRADRLGHRGRAAALARQGARALSREDRHLRAGRVHPARRLRARGAAGPLGFGESAISWSARATPRRRRASSARSTSSGSLRG